MVVITTVYRPFSVPTIYVDIFIDRTTHIIIITKIITIITIIMITRNYNHKY